MRCHARRLYIACCSHGQAPHGGEDALNSCAIVSGMEAETASSAALVMNTVRTNISNLSPEEGRWQGVVRREERPFKECPSLRKEGRRVRPLEGESWRLILIYTPIKYCNASSLYNTCEHSKGFCLLSTRAHHQQHSSARIAPTSWRGHARVSHARRTLFTVC